MPHKLAYKAYLEAVARFRAVRPRHTPSDCSPSDSAELLGSSAVLLLANPAHQTALNARKRLILLGRHSASHELRFTDALLTLREGTKQSILWHHRRWLLRRIHPPLPSPFPASSSGSAWGDGVDTLHDIALPPDAFRAEIAAVERACEAYPRNYHAWAHRFLCAQALLLFAFHSAPSSSSPASSVPASSLSVSPSSGEVKLALEEERARIRTWVERHVADYSAVQYACRLDLLLSAADLGIGIGIGTGAHALELVRAYPAHEALWLYLRGAVALGLFPPGRGMRGDADVAIDELVEKYIGEDADAMAVAGAREGKEGRAHAVRFVAWMAWLVSVSIVVVVGDTPGADRVGYRGT